MKRFIKASQLSSLAVGLLCLSAPAFAGGHWEISYQSTGSCVGFDPDCYFLHGEQIQSEGTHPWLPSGAINHHVSLEGNFDKFDEPLHISSSGDVLVTFTWKPDSPQDLPPTKLSVLENLDLSDPYDYGYPHITVVPQHTTSVKGNKGKGVVQISNPDRSSVLKLPMRHLQVTADAQNQTDSTAIEAIVRYSAQPDTRFLNLTRGGAGPVVPEKVRDTVTGNIIDNPDLLRTRDEWIGEDGSGHGHTLASYYDRVMVGEGMNRGAEDDAHDITQTISANIDGPWTTDPNRLAWQWTPSTGDPAPSQNAGGGVWAAQRESSVGQIAAETKQYQIRVMPRSDAIYNPEGIGGLLEEAGALPPGWINQPSSKSKFLIHYTYVLADVGNPNDSSDDVTDTATYDLTLHDEWADAIPDDRYHPVGDTSSPGATKEEDFIVPSNAAVIQLHDVCTWELSSTENLEFKLESSFEAGFKLGDWGNAKGSINATKTFTKEDLIKTSPPPLLGEGSDPRYAAELDGVNIRFQTVLVFQATREHKLLNHFAQQGFVESDEGKEANPMDPLTIPRTFIPRSDARWGRTPQSKVTDLSQPRADWRPYRLGQNFPNVGEGGKWDFYGSASAGSS